MPIRRLYEVLIRRHGRRLKALRLAAAMAVTVVGGLYLAGHREKSEFVITVVTAVCSLVALLARDVTSLLISDVDMRAVKHSPASLVEMVATAQRKQWRKELSTRKLTDHRLPLTWRLSPTTSLDDVQALIDPVLQLRITLWG